MLMVNRLETSTMKSERAFATFRVAGDNLDPNRLTELLGIEPSLAYSKGEKYSLGPRSGALKGRTGLWFLSTDDAVKTSRLSDHVQWLLGKITPKQRELSQFIYQNSLHAVMTCFWHGPSGTDAPFVSSEVRQMLEKIPAKLEEDFDSDDGRSVRINLRAY